MKLFNAALTIIMLGAAFLGGCAELAFLVKEQKFSLCNGLD